MGGRLMKLFPVALLLSILISVYSNAEACSGAEALLLAANRALEKGNLTEAKNLFAQVQASHPRCGKVLLGRGQIAAARGDLETAIQLLSRYKDEAPTDAEGYYHLAAVYFSQGNYRRADVMSELAVVFAPEHPEALVLRARILMMKGQNAQAEEKLKRACELVPDDPDAHFQLGVLFDTYKRNTEAAEQFRKVIELDPRNPQSYDYLALNLEPLGEIQEAEEAYQKGLEVNGGPLFDRFLDYNYGRFLIKQNRLLEAKKYLDHALELAPNTRAVHYEHAKLNLRLGKNAEARADLEKALSLPDSSGFILDLQVYYLLSQAYARLGQKELARKYAELSREARVPIQGRERK